MNSRKKNLFTEVPRSKVRRNLFDLSHEVKMSGKFGFLYPILCMDALPGDTIRDTMNVFVRFAPLLAPVMHRCDVTTHFFFVPNRIICDHWEEFITGGQDGLSAITLPYITPAGNALAGGANFHAKGTLWDYLGLPTFTSDEGVPPPPAVWSDEHISVLPFRACAKVWNDYYRDPNLQDEKVLDEDLQGDVSQESWDSGIVRIEQYRRGFEKDYFTSALPWAQRGAQVLMPLSGVAGDADIVYKDGANETILWHSDGTAIGTGGELQAIPGPGDGAFLRNTGETKPLDVKNIDSITFANASTTINDFRRALAIQRWLENNARGGARYVEQVLSHFNVQVPDYRLQRAEYLGGGKQPVQISEVLSTAEAGTKEVGDMAGHGISVGRTNKFTYRCQEHGWVVGFLSVTMRTAYSQGIPKMWTREDKYEFGWPELAHLGEQEILSKELFYSFDADDDDDNGVTFGYIPRYAEYKFMNDRIAGDFRDNLGFWHLGRKFTSRPSLDASFTTIFEDSADYEESFRRIFAVQDGTDYLWMQLYHHLTAKRPLPYFGVPNII